jgi:chemotaxis protein MotB
MTERKIPNVVFDKVDEGETVDPIIEASTMPPESGADLEEDREFDSPEYVRNRPNVQGGLDVYAGVMNTAGHEHYSGQPRSLRRNSHWSVAWADLMMTMFILFMVMFVYKTADREFLSGDGLGNNSGEEIGREVVDVGPGGSNDFHEYGQKVYSKKYDFSRLTNLEQDLRDFAEINLAPDKTLRIILTGDLLFPLGQKVMTSEGMARLKKVAVFLRDTPYKINVIGHTDNTPLRGGTTPTNWELSTDRACSVVHYLIGEARLPANQFYVTGHGEYRPAVPNDSPVNRAKNRRVEIVVTKELPGALPLGAADL